MRQNSASSKTGTDGWICLKYSWTNSSIALEVGKLKHLFDARSATSSEGSDIDCCNSTKAYSVYGTSGDWGGFVPRSSKLRPCALSCETRVEWSLDWCRSSQCCPVITVFDPELWCAGFADPDDLIEFSKWLLNESFSLIVLLLRIIVTKYTFPAAVLSAPGTRRPESCCIAAHFAMAAPGASCWCSFYTSQHFVYDVQSLFTLVLGGEMTEWI